MNAYLVALSLVLLGLAAVPTASADQYYCAKNIQMCCAANEDAVGDLVIRGCQVADNGVGAGGIIVGAILDLVDCAVNGNC